MIRKNKQRINNKMLLVIPLPMDFFFFFFLIIKHFTNNFHRFMVPHVKNFEDYLSLCNGRFWIQRYYVGVFKQQDKCEYVSCF